MPDMMPITPYTGNLLELQRKQALAQMLQQQSLQPIQSETAGGYVVPISPMQGVAQMLKAYVGANINKDIDNQYGDIYSKMSSQLMGNNPYGPQGSVSSMGDVLRGNATSLGQTIDNQPSDPRAAEFWKQGMAYQMMGQPEAAKAMFDAANKIGALPPPDVVRLANAAGQDPKLAAQGALLKDTTVPIRPGGWLLGANGPTQYPVAEAGTTNIPLPGGGFQNQVVPGALENMSNVEQSKAMGKAAAEPIVVQTPGNPTMSTKANVVNAAQGQPLKGFALQNETQGTEQKQTGKNLADYTQKVVDTAASSTTLRNNVSQMRQLASTFTPSLLAPAKKKLGEIGIALGMDPEMINKDLGNIGSMQAMGSIIIKMAGQATRQSDAQPSQLQFLKNLESQPGIERTPEGMQKILQWMQDLADYDIAKNKALQHYKDKTGSAEGFENAWSDYSQKLPLFANNPAFK